MSLKGMVQWMKRTVVNEKLDEAVNWNNLGEQVKVTIFHPTRPWNLSTPPSQTPACPCLYTKQWHKNETFWISLTSRSNWWMLQIWLLNLKLSCGRPEKSNFFYHIETPISVERVLRWSTVKYHLTTASQSLWKCAISYKIKTKHPK